MIVALVPQPVIGEDSGAMCDCCEVLASIKMPSQTSAKGVQHHYVRVNPEECSACETCAGRCQMEAIEINENQVAEVDLDRCIGCGPCVTTCPNQAVSLQLKPETNDGNFRHHSETSSCKWVP